MNSRREFIAIAGSAAFALTAAKIAWAQAKSPFKLSVISDEISDDFDHACSVIAKDFGLGWVELRSMWGKNIVDLKADDVTRAQAVLVKYNLQVTDIASPLFKVDWPGAPLSAARSKTGTKLDTFKATASYKKQDDVLANCISLAKQFKTDKVRCFDFWRLDDPAPYRAAIDDALQTASEKARKQGVSLVIENEHECNTVTAAEIVRVLAAVPALSVNWDPANAVMHGELDAFPAGFRMLPKDRILHCHAKNVVRNGAGSLEWAPVGTGIIDWAGQFRALKEIGYHGAVSLETHWRAGTPEASSRVSWAGMKKALEDSGTF